MEVSQQQIKNFVASCIIVQFLCQSARLYYLSTFIDAFRLIGGSRRVTLVVAFGFSPKILREGNNLQSTLVLYRSMGAG